MKPGTGGKAARLLSGAWYLPHLKTVRNENKLRARKNFAKVQDFIPEGRDLALLLESFLLGLLLL